MNFFKNTLLMIMLLVVGSSNAHETRPMGFEQIGSDQSLFGSNSVDSDSEDFWKIFSSGLHEQLNESVKKIPKKDALALVGAMNNVADAFNSQSSGIAIRRK